MANIGLTSGEAFLRDAARTLFEERYEKPKMHVGRELHRELQWTPALRFVIYGYINVFVEPSESGPYPRILELKYADVLNFPEPISIYAVCPENVISTPAQRAEMKRLKAHRHGLVMVDSSGRANRVFSPTPLVQVISEAEFRNSIGALPLTIRRTIERGLRGVSESSGQWCEVVVGDCRRASAGGRKTGDKEEVHFGRGG